MIRTLREILDEALRPSRADETAHYAFCIAIAHATLGSALMWLLLLTGVSFAAGLVLIPVLYLVLKEIGDLRRGALAIDSLADTAMVLSGCALHGTLFWAPLVAILALVAVTLVRRAVEDLP